MSAAALRPSSAVYREEQNFDWRVYATLSALSISTLVVFAIVRNRVPALDAAGHSAIYAWPFAIGVSVVAPINLVFWILRMTTEVAPGEIRVWFGRVPTFRRSICTAAITRVEVVRFRPIRDHAGWGIRHARDGSLVFSARGDRGVRLEFVDGATVILGSQTPDLLAAAIDNEVNPCG
ncbi:MAG: hypothetical protein KGM43_17295 [Planctomycetota bacterium]|nr:hypothetical protein [Planctomycetota bacterium]